MKKKTPTFTSAGLRQLFFSLSPLHAVICLFVYILLFLCDQILVVSLSLLLLCAILAMEYSTYAAHKNPCVMYFDGQPFFHTDEPLVI